MLLKRARRKERPNAQEGPGDMTHHHEAPPTHEPVISRWSTASCLAYQPSAGFQQYLVGDCPCPKLGSRHDPECVLAICTESDYCLLSVMSCAESLMPRQRQAQWEGSR